MPSLTAYLTVDEVAEMLRISKMSVYRLVKAGDIPALRFGRVFRIDPVDLETFIKDSAA